MVMKPPMARSMLKRAFPFKPMNALFRPVVRGKNKILANRAIQSFGNRLCENRCLAGSLTTIRFGKSTMLSTILSISEMLFWTLRLERAICTNYRLRRRFGDIQVVGRISAGNSPLVNNAPTRKDRRAQVDLRASPDYILSDLDALTH
jgi:hypothetical protein